MEHTKRMAAPVLVIYYLLVIALAVLVNLVLFPGPWFDPLERASAGLVNATLQANLLGLLLFALFVFWLGRLRPAAVGLEWGKLPRALLLTGLLWLAMQAVCLVISAVMGGVSLDPAWTRRGVSGMFGLLISQLLGNALAEELVYRGLLLPQFFLRLRIARRKWRTTAAAALMLALFILSHIPNRIFQGYSVGGMLLDAPILLLWGLLFTIVYLRTGNLFLAVGIHALVNAPTLVSGFTLFPPQLILLALVILLLIFWRKEKPAAVSAMETAQR